MLTILSAAEELIKEETRHAKALAKIVTQLDEKQLLFDPADKVLVGQVMGTLNILIADNKEEREVLQEASTVALRLFVRSTLERLK